MNYKTKVTPPIYNCWKAPRFDQYNRSRSSIFGPVVRPFKKWTILLATLIQIFMATSSSAQDQQLIYFGDPMCSWCYGFGSELDQIHAAFPDLDFKMVMGGLRPYGKEKMSELDDFLENHWDEIHNKTGKAFKKDILKDLDFVYDTEPPSRAVVTFRKFLPEKELSFFHAVQRAFYANNKNTHLLDTYLEILDDFDVDKQSFTKAWKSEEMDRATLAEFRYSGQVGIRGFPSLVLKKGDQYTIVSNGYAKAEGIIRSIKKELDKN
ncbi:MAG: DsbA family protein [Saprospiraceae bacterium]|nr:DsbA family protein [Saprospiraceae bacterium]